MVNKYNSRVKKYSKKLEKWDSSRSNPIWSLLDNRQSSLLVYASFHHSLYIFQLLQMILEPDTGRCTIEGTGPKSGGLWDPTSAEERNETFFIKVWKTLPSIRVKRKSEKKKLKKDNIY